MHTAQVIVLATLAAGFILLPAPVRAEESLIPKDMAYIAHGASVMGVDKEEPVDSGKKTYTVRPTDEDTLVGRGVT
jgi:hypothetical protein